MKIKFDKSGVATISMTVEELGNVRYAMNAGVEKLEMTALYFKSAKVSKTLQKSASDTAKRCKAAQKALEQATLKYVRSGKKP